MRLGLRSESIVRSAPPKLVATKRVRVGVHHWPLHDIATANIVWCMENTRRVGWGSYIAY